MRTHLLRLFSSLTLSLSIAVLLSGLASGQSSAPTGADSSHALREIPVFDLNAIDKTIDPCVDFYQYACGSWMKNNPIPADKSRWGRFDELADHNLSYSARHTDRSAGIREALGYRDHGGCLLRLLHG